MSPLRKFVVKLSGHDPVDVEVSEELTVQDLKAILAEKTSIAPPQQRLIYSGRILKDLESLAAYSIKEGSTVHLVKGAAPKTASSASAGAGSRAATPQSRAAAVGAPPPSAMAAGQETGNILSDLTGARYSGLANLPSASLFGPDGGQGPMPSMDDINAMLASNPEMMEQVASMMAESTNESSPLFQMMPEHVREEARTLMANPEVRALMSDPQRLQQFMQASVQLQQLTNPGGSGSSLGQAMGNPLGRSTGDNPLSALGLSGFGGLPAAPVDTRPPEERFEVQLRQLNELGFCDFDRNILALRRSGGNVEGAVEALLDGHV